MLSEIENLKSHSYLKDVFPLFQMPYLPITSTFNQSASDSSQTRESTLSNKFSKIFEAYWAVVLIVGNLAIAVHQSSYRQAPSR